MKLHPRLSGSVELKHLLRKLQTVLLVAFSRTFGLMATFAISVVIARLFDADVYGRYATILAIVITLSIPLVGGMQTYLVRETARTRENPTAALNLLCQLQRLSRQYSLGLVLVLYAGIYILGPDKDSLLINWLAIAILAIYPTAIIQNYSAFARGQGWSNLGTFFEYLLRPAFLLLCLFALYLFSSDLREFWIYVLHVTSIGACALAIVTLVRGRLTDSRLTNKSKTWRFIYTKDGLGYLTVIGGLQVLLVNIDLLVISWMLPSSDVALYKIALQFGVLTGFGLTIVNLILQPILAEHFAKSDMVAFQRDLTFYTTINQVLTAALCAGIYVFRHDLVLLIFGASYAQSTQLIPYILLGQLVNVMSGSSGVVLNMTNNHRYVLNGFIISIVTMVLILTYAVPVYGLTGAGIAYCVSFFSWNLYLIVKVKSALGVDTSPLLYLAYRLTGRT